MGMEQLETQPHIARSITPQEEILAVEDDPAQAKLLIRLLEPMGFKVHTEPLGTAALQYASEHVVSLTILDLRLPDIDGYEVCRRLREQYNPWVMPVLMLTERSRPTDQLRGYAEGADAYLTKPYHPVELLKTIALLLGRAEDPDSNCADHW